jgi:hypothetical protein
MKLSFSYFFPSRFEHCALTNKSANKPGFFAGIWDFLHFGRRQRRKTRLQRELRSTNAEDVRGVDDVIQERPGASLEV